MVQMVKESASNDGGSSNILKWERSLEVGMTTHF